MPLLTRLSRLLEANYKVIFIFLSDFSLRRVYKLGLSVIKNDKINQTNS